MLFPLFYAEENYAPLKSVDAYGYFFMIDNFLPSLGHAFAPIDIVKNYYGIVVYVFDQ